MGTNPEASLGLTMGFALAEQAQPSPVATLSQVFPSGRGPSVHEQPALT
jgi:hypothetical protein